MEDGKDMKPGAADDFDLFKAFNRCLREWKMILRWTLVAGAIGLVVAFSTPREYMAKSLLAPEIAKKTSSSLNSIATLTGVNLNALSNSEAMTPEVYPDVVYSTPFIVDMFSIPVSFKWKGEVVETDIYTYMKDYGRSSWWGEIIHFPGKVIGMFFSLFKEKVDYPEGFQNVDPSMLTPEQQGVAKAIRSRIGITVEKKTNLITITATAQNPRIAYLMCDSISTLLQRYVTEYHTEKARNDAEYYQKVFDKAQKEYFAAQQAYSAYVDANHGIIRLSHRIEEDRLKNELDLRYKIYNSCAQQLQSAQAKIQLDTPAFVVASPATTPLRPFKPEKMKLTVGFLLLGAFAAVVWILYGRGLLEKFRVSGIQ